MIEYITQTGAFGYLWILTFISFIGITYRFIKTNGVFKLVPIVVPIIVILFLFNFMGIELMGKSQFDLPLTFVKDMWFLMGHVFIVTALTMTDKTCLEFWKKQVNSNKL